MSEIPKTEIIDVENNENLREDPDWTPPTLEERVKLLEEKMAYTGAFIRSFKKQKGKEAYNKGNI